MSVVVWDGKTLAADRQCTNFGLRYACTKMRRLTDGTVLAIVGHMDSGLLMMDWYESGCKKEEWPLMDWYESGCKKEEWPLVQSDNDRWSRLIILFPDGRLAQYERCPALEYITTAPLAWGGGADFAMGAMAMGADARRAVEIASIYSEGCGFGVEAFDVMPLALGAAGD